MGGGDSTGERSDVRARTSGSHQGGSTSITSRSLQSSAAWAWAWVEALT